MSYAQGMPVLQALPQVQVRRVFATSPERLFAAWTEPAQLARWWGRADRQEMLHCEGEARDGGGFLIETLDPEGKQLRFWGRYQRLSSPRLAVYTWSVGRVEHGELVQTLVSDSLVEVEFRPCPEGCELLIRHSLLPGAPVCLTISNGWEGQARALEAFLAEPGIAQCSLSVPAEGRYPAVRDIVMDLEIASEPAEVFRWLSEAKLLTQWFPDIAVTEPRAGGDYRFEWQSAGKPNHFRFGRFTEFEPGRLLAHSWYPYALSPQGEALGPPFESGMSEVRWELEPAGPGCRLQLVHSGFSYADEAANTAYVGHGEGWTKFVNNLKSVLEHGLDLRQPSAGKEH